ncbi:MAG: FKBP-type peptidyl-prolyl cis-trans isomerase, partial [Niabella sp.]
VLMAKMKKEAEAKFNKDLADLEKTGQKAMQDKVVQNYLAGKNITATTLPKGAMVKIDNPGSGDGLTDGKWAKIKYVGRLFDKDSVFDSGEFPIHIGEGGAIPGFEEGLKAFKNGGKGTIYLPGYLAYGKEGAGGKFKPYAPMYFDVQVLSVTDTMPQMAPPAPPTPQPQTTSKK